MNVPFNDNKQCGTWDSHKQHAVTFRFACSYVFIPFTMDEYLQASCLHKQMRYWHFLEPADGAIQLALLIVAQGGFNDALNSQMTHNLGRWDGLSSLLVHFEMHLEWTRDVFLGTRRKQGEFLKCCQLNRENVFKKTPSWTESLEKFL